jgi:3D-(3,5/4)-trihydroxycyclohexane-1,2-dione acylhydrolase (decyclizing)
MARMTAAQALVRFLMAQKTEQGGRELPLFAGIFAIFGHGNVAGLGEALEAVRGDFPTLRAHNEQAMAHAALAFAKASFRRRMLACTSSVGPGATNLVTAAALAHANRLPVLLLPGDVFASRRPDPVLQQIEDFGDPTVSANDCFRPVARFWDRITRPEQLLSSLPAALRVLTDPADCGPAVVCLPQDVQAEAADFPDAFFAPRLHRPRRPRPDAAELRAAAQRLAASRRPLLVAGGGVLYSGAGAALASFAERARVPVAETQAGKGALPWTCEQDVGAIGVTGSAAANALAREADLVLAVGTRLQDFTTGSRALFRGGLLQLNVASFDAAKQGALPLVADAREGLLALAEALPEWRADPAWAARAAQERRAWLAAVERATARPTSAGLPSDAQVLGAVNRRAAARDIVVCAAGGLPGELHKLWRTETPGGYHVEYGYSCMGYEIAGGLGVKLAHPDRRVFVLVGDGSYLMLNSEIATSVAMGLKLDIVLLDNGGFGCIHRLQEACGGRPYNNLRAGAAEGGPAVAIDFAAHARSLGALAERVDSIGALEEALERAARSPRTHVVVIETDPAAATAEGGAWWDVPIAEVSPSPAVRRAREAYVRERERRDRD